MVQAEDEAPQDSQATVQVQAEVHAHPDDAVIPDPDAGPVAPGEAEAAAAAAEAAEAAAADGQYILFYSFQYLFICKFCYFKISILNFNLYYFKL